MAVKIDNEKCTGCGECASICGLEAIKIEDGKAVVSEGCVVCGACVNQCLNGAISF
jgi:ferredoxin